MAAIGSDLRADEECVIEWFGRDAIDALLEVETA
jgi:hypothetical protein